MLPGYFINAEWKHDINSALVVSSYILPPGESLSLYEG